MTLFDLSSLLSYVHADAPAEDMPEVDEVVVEEEEAEEEEPEDHMPQVVEACVETPKCAELNHHLKECTARVEAGANEDCVEEFFHLMHCVDHCAAGPIFAKLK